MAALAINSPISAEIADWFDGLTTGVAVLDADLRFIHANAAFVETAGIARWRGCPLEILGDIATPLSAAAARVRDARESVTLRGLELTVRDASVRIDAALGNCAAGILLELHPLGSQESSGAPQRISQSLRGLAHEVKNPLAGLRGAAQLLRRRVADSDQRLADLIIAEADRLGALTDRLLHPSGKPHLAMVNLHEVAERARALIAIEAAPEVRIERDYDPSLPNFRGDADRLQQVVLNLLRNALQADTRSILLRTRAEHGASALTPSRTALRLDVIDDGAGVPDALRESLFAPLVSGRADGTGLGLALAQEIAAEHGGQLDFRSRPGHTVFSLWVPLERNVPSQEHESG